MIAFSIFDKSCKRALVRAIITCVIPVFWRRKEERKSLNKLLIMSAISIRPIRKCSLGYFHRCKCELLAGLLEQYLALLLLLFNLSLAFRWHETASASILRLPISGGLSDRHRTAHPLCKPFPYHHEIRVAVATRCRLLLLHKWESKHSGSEVHILDACRNYLRPVTFLRGTGGQSDIILAHC